MLILCSFLLVLLPSLYFAAESPFSVSFYSSTDSDVEEADDSPFFKNEFIYSEEEYYSEEDDYANDSLVSNAINVSDEIHSS